MEPEKNLTETSEKTEDSTQTEILEQPEMIKPVKIIKRGAVSKKNKTLAPAPKPEQIKIPIQPEITELLEQTETTAKTEQIKIPTQTELTEKPDDKKDQSENPEALKKEENSDLSTEDLEQKELCPPYCPFLRTEDFHCNLFSCQLMASPPLVFKCKECMDSDTRKSAYKAKVKDFEKRVYMWDKALKRTPFDLWGKVKSHVTDWKERKVFKEFLMSLAGSLPILMDVKMSKLLLNLYLVLDSSEKQIMKSILSNPKAAEILIKKIKEVGKTPNLLKIVRKEMDNIALKQKNETKEMEKMKKIMQNNLQR